VRSRTLGTEVGLVARLCGQFDYDGVVDARLGAVALDGRLRTLVDECDRGVDRLRPDDREARRGSESAAKLVREDHGRRVADGDEERAVGEKVDGHRREAAREVLGQEDRHFQIDVDLFELDERELVLLGDQPGHLGLSDDAALDEELAEPPSRDPLLPGVALIVQDGFEIFLCHEPIPHEQDPECGPRVWSRFHRSEISAHMPPSFTATRITLCARSCSGCGRPP